jgi:PAS domain S-box-containing protein
MQYVIFIFMAPLVAVFMVIVAVVVQRRPSSELALPLSLVLWIAIGNLVMNSLELAWPAPEGTMLFAKIGYIFSTLIPVTLLLFTVRFTGNTRWLRAGRWLFLLIVPAATTLLAFTEPRHGLIWRSISYQPVAGMLAMNVQYGWFFWVNFSYSVGILFLCFGLMVWENFRAPTAFRAQSLLAIVGVLIPQALFVVYSLKLIPGLTKNFSPIAYCATGLCFVAAITRHGFLDLVPIARRTLVEEMGEAMVVVDMQSRIVDVNAKARSILGLPPDVIGQTIGKDSRLAEALPLDPTREQHREMAVGAAESIRYFDAGVSPIKDTKGRALLGSMILFRDITDTHILLEEKNRLIDKLTQASAEIRTLQGIIPICMYCKKIRDDTGYWHQVESYVSARSNAQFSHGLCPDCMKKLEQSNFGPQA